MFNKSNNFNKKSKPMLKQLSEKFYCIEPLSKVAAQQKLRISVTNSCNFNCFFCHNEGQTNKSTNSMTVSELTKIVEVAILCGVKDVKLTGGEPLLYSNEQFDIIDLVKSIVSLKKNGYQFSLSIVTNGYLLSKYARSLKKAGLDRINISLATLNDRTFAKFICQDQKKPIKNITEGIISAINENLRPVKVNMPLFYSSDSGDGNIFEIPDIIKFCKNNYLDELRLYTLLWHDNFPDFHTYYHYWNSHVFSKMKLFDLPEDLRKKLMNDLRKFSINWASSQYPARMVINSDGLAIVFETMMVGRLKEQTLCKNCKKYDLCQEGPYAIRVSSNGMLRICLLKEQSVNLLELIQNGAHDKELISAFKSGSYFF